MRVPKTVDEFITAPLVEWEKTVDAMTPEQRGQMSDMLDAIAQKCARAAGYVSHRYGCGCGDHGHNSAVKNANKVLSGVRKALGYTLPKAANVEF